MQKKDSIFPWNQSITADKGDERAEEVYTAVGRAMSCWEEVEISLTNLLRFAGQNFETSDFETSENVWMNYRESGIFVERIAKVEAALENYFRKRCSRENEGNIATILKSIRNLADRRNDIAHGVVKQKLIVSIVSGPNRMGGYNISGGGGFFLIPPQYNVQKWSKPRGPMYAYTSEQINSFSDYFIAYRDKVLEFQR